MKPKIADHLDKELKIHCPNCSVALYRYDMQYYPRIITKAFYPLDSEFDVREDFKCPLCLKPIFN